MRFSLLTAGLLGLGLGLGALSASAQDKAAELNRGDILEVFCTDPGALNDIPAWCRIHGHQVLDANETDDEVIIRLKLA